MDVNLEELSNLFRAGLPVWIVAFGGLVCLTIDALFRRGTYLTYVVGIVTLLAALTGAFKLWLADSVPVQSVLITDRVTLYFVFVLLFIGLITLLNTFSYMRLIDQQGSSESMAGSLVSLILFALVGTIFLFASNNMILIFIGIETLSLAVYILVGSRREDVRSNEASMKYFVLGSVASAILLYGISMLYGAHATLNLLEIGQRPPTPTLEWLPRIGLCLILAGLLFKMALAPFHFWVPDIYEGAPAPITGFMATGVKLGAFALFIRFLTHFPFASQENFPFILSTIVVITLAVGNFGAMIQDNVKRMLAYSSITHAGFLLLGIVAGINKGALQGHVTSAVLFYLLVYSLMTLGTFAILSTMIRERREVTQYSDLIGLGYQRPYLAAALALFMLSLLGIPPTAGFIAKYYVLSYAVENGYVGIAVFGVLATLVSAYYYLKVIVMMYFRGQPHWGQPHWGQPQLDQPHGTQSIQEVPLPLMFAIVFCALAILYLGLFPMDYLQMTELAVK